MKTKKSSRVLSLLIGVAMVFTMLPITAFAAGGVVEQFNLPINQTYYFDLSSEAGKIGTINPVLPDATLHYVPFTYAGTVNAYSLDSSSSGNTGASAAATASDRSLFVADYNVGTKISWDALNAANLIFGKTLDTNYKLRSLSVGSNSTGSGEAMRGTPTSNEWDSILNKSPDGIKNWKSFYSSGQDTTSNSEPNRAIRGNASARYWTPLAPSMPQKQTGFRPALEVLNPVTLGAGGLKAINLNLNGGNLGTDTSVTSMNIVYTGSSYTVPSATGLTPKTGCTDTGFKWNTAADGNGTSYAAGATVPDSVTTLYAQRGAPAAQTVSFDARNGASIADATAGENGKITLPADPTWNDYTFAGWYTDVDGKGTAVTADTVHSANTKVYAKWTKGGKTVLTDLLYIDQSVVNTSKLETEGWKFEKNVLTLDGFNLHSKTSDGIAFSIMYSNYEIVLVGENTIICENKTSTNNAYALSSSMPTFIKGSGKLTAIGSSGMLMDEVTIENATVTAKGTDQENGKGLSAQREITLKSGTLIASGEWSAIDTLFGTITAEGATVTGATQDFVSGSTTCLMQTNQATPVIIRFGPPPEPTFDVDYDVVGGAGQGSRLEGSLGTIVTDPKGGVTAADKAAGNSVSLKLTVAETAAGSTPDGEQIEGVKQGDSVQYYDVTVEKTVTPQGGTPTTTKLTSIPKPVRAIIPVPAAIQGKSSYTVYRVHNGVAEKIPNDPTAPEFYSVNDGGTSLTLHVKNFSTYAVITGDKSLSGNGTLGDATNPISSAVDVQGKVLEGVFGIYKLDISWGAMKFDYNATGGVWDPDAHSYIPGSGTKGWTNESFEADNNKITVANHSNGDVTLGYLAMPNAALAGVTMTVRSTNSLAGIEAEDILLEKVPTETAAAPTVDTYVWLTGEPTDLAALNDKSYTKAGVITITAEADTASGLTPKNS